MARFGQALIAAHAEAKAPLHEMSVLESNHGAGVLAPRQPRRQDGALAHVRAAGDHDPPGLGRLIEPQVELFVVMVRRFAHGL
jgi:hypothetical protein